jgi:hypothetical protein
MKPAVYLTDPAEMRRVRLNQPHVTSAQARAQRERLRHASEASSLAASAATSSRGRVKTAA